MGHELIYSTSELVSQVLLLLSFKGNDKRFRVYLMISYKSSAIV